jgi:hypothetical protein
MGRFLGVGAGWPAAMRTSAGPTACQEFTSLRRLRSSGTRPRAYSGRPPRRRAAATHSGTYWTGSRASIGTRTSCVGTAEPVPITKSIREASA